MKRNSIIIFKVDSMGDEGFYLLEKLGWARQVAIKSNGWMKLLVTKKDMELLEWLCKLTNTPYEAYRSY